MTDPDAPSRGPAGSVAVGRPPRSRRRRFARFLAWTALTLSVLLFASTGALYAAYNHYGGRIQTLPGLVDLQDGQGGVTRAENYLVVGSDSADGLTDAQLREVGTNRSQREGVRPDTILLVHVPADGSAAQVVSLPRDSYVEIPGHAKNKINSAYETGEEAAPGGGPQLLVDTVEQLTGLQVDHYVQVSLYGFYTITNAIGGVEVCLTRPAKDEDANIDLPAGVQTLQGKDALAFVRQRKGVPGGDLGRIRRQQYYLGALTRQALSAGVLLNPGRLNDLLNAVGNNLLVDPGTDRSDMLDLAFRLRGVSAGKVTFRTVPIAGDGLVDVPGPVDAAVVLLDEPALPGFFATLGNPVAAPAGPPLTVPPASIRVRVDNASGRAGLGTQVADALERVGFAAATVGTAGTTSTTTVVRHGTDRADSAQTVAAALPGAVVQADPDLPTSGLVVSVGSGYRGTQAVKVPKNGAVATPPSTAADRGCIA